MGDVDDVPQTLVTGQMSSDEAESTLLEIRGLRSAVGQLRDELRKGRKWSRRLFVIIMASVLVVGGVVGGGLLYINHKVSQNNSFSCDTYRDLQKLRPGLSGPVGEGILNDFGKLYDRYNCKPPLSEVIKQIQQEAKTHK